MTRSNLALSLFSLHSSVTIYKVCCQVQSFVFIIMPLESALSISSLNNFTLHIKLWFSSNCFWKTTTLPNAFLFIFLIAFHPSSEFLQTLSPHNISNNRVNTSYIWRMMPCCSFSYWHILSIMSLMTRIELNKWHLGGWWLEPMFWGPSKNVCES